MPGTARNHTTGIHTDVWTGELWFDAYMNYVPVHRYISEFYYDTVEIGTSI